MLGHGRACIRAVRESFRRACHGDVALSREHYGGKCAARGLTARGSMAIGHDGNIAIGFKRDISAKASARQFCHIVPFIARRVCSTPRHATTVQRLKARW
jgi:hypothetical protein